MMLIIFASPSYNQSKPNHSGRIDTSLLGWNHPTVSPVNGKIQHADYQRPVQR